MQSGFVAIIGRPNVGKSTFVNTVVGTNLAAVSDRPQTTWHQIRGIFTDERGQVVLIDTPGVHAAESAINQAMIANAVDAAMSADAVLLILDATHRKPLDEHLLELLGDAGKLLVMVNKIDLATPAQMVEMDTYLKERDIKGYFVSAANNAGIDEVIANLFEYLPEGPPLYDPEMAGDRSMRFLVSEYIRQGVFEYLQDELPYDIFVEIDDFREQEKPVRIEATIHVARKSQKQIVIGAGGAMLKKIGIRARQLIEETMGEQVNLQLWVKVLHKWNKKEAMLRRAGVLLPGRQQARAQKQAGSWLPKE